MKMRYKKIYCKNCCKITVHSKPSIFWNLLACIFARPLSYDCDECGW